MGPSARRLAGERLHLQHGPIDLIIGVTGARNAAFAAAEARFATILDELVAELPLLRSWMAQATPLPQGTVARAMDHAVRPHLPLGVTPMAAVAGAVADTILATICAKSQVTRAYVNNGGDAAFFIAPSQDFTAAIAGVDGADLGRVRVRATDAPRGMATSGWRGRSHSLGIADSVTVLARSAAQADVAATLIANAVDLPEHSGICRTQACDLAPDSDLGTRLVTTAVPRLGLRQVQTALARGLARARRMSRAGLIDGAVLQLQGAVAVLDDAALFQKIEVAEHV